MPSSRSRYPAPVRKAVELLGDRRALPDFTWLERLLGRPRADIERLLREVERCADLERTIRARHTEGGRSFYAQFRAPLELYALVRALRPAEVVETGVSSGVSSAHVLFALRENGTGRLHSIDAPLPQKGEQLAKRESAVSLPPGRGSGWAMPDELRAGWDLRLGESQRLLPALVAELPRVDLFLHDSLHTPKHLTFELETIRPKLGAGSVVLADNTEWTGKAFDRFAASYGVRFYRRRRSDLVGIRVPGPSDGPRAGGTR